MTEPAGRKCPTNSSDDGPWFWGDGKEFVVATSDGFAIGRFEFERDAVEFVCGRLLRRLKDEEDDLVFKVYDCRPGQKPTLVFATESGSTKTTG